MSDYCFLNENFKLLLLLYYAQLYVFNNICESIQFGNVPFRLKSTEYHLLSYKKVISPITMDFEGGQKSALGVPILLETFIN